MAYLFIQELGYITVKEPTEMVLEMIKKGHQFLELKQQVSISCGEKLDFKPDRIDYNYIVINTAYIITMK